MVCTVHSEPYWEASPLPLNETLTSYTGSSWPLLIVTDKYAVFLFMTFTPPVPNSWVRS